MLTKIQISSFYLASILFLWKFQISVGNVAVPAYVFLAPLTLLWGIPSLVMRRTFLAAIIITAAMVFAYLQGVELFRLLVTISALFVLLFNWLAVGTSIFAAQNDRWKTISGLIKILIRLQVAIQIAQIVGIPFLEYRTSPHYFLPIIRAPGFSIEPSHLAITLSPLIFSSMWANKLSWGGRLRPIDYILVYLSLFLCPSTTSLIVISLAAFLRVTVKFPLTSLVAVGTLVFIVQYAYIIIALLPTEIQDRIDTLIMIFNSGFFDRDSNYSSVVFYGGWQAAITSLKHYPLGVGFLNMEAVYNLPSFELYREVAGNSNIRDGSSILFKLITEFGYIGLAFCIYAVTMLWSFLARNRTDITIGVLAFPLLAFFVRGASYLDGAVLISVAIAIFGAASIAVRRHKVASSIDP